MQIKHNPISVSIAIIRFDNLGRDKKIYPKSLYTKAIDGILWSSLPKIKNRFLLSFIKDYHFADINLFWKDIEENAVLRVQSWLKKN